MDRLVDLLDPTRRIQRAWQILWEFAGGAPRRKSIESAIARSSATIEELVLPVREGPAVAALDSLRELSGFPMEEPYGRPIREAQGQCGTRPDVVTIASHD
jgi:hypothetical protein